MKLTGHQVMPERCLSAMSVEGASVAWRSGDVVRWLDVEGATTDELEELLSRFDVHPLVLERCLEPGQGSRFSNCDDTLLIEFPARGPERSDELLEVIILCFPSMLMTIRSAHAPRLATVIAELSQPGSLCTARVPGLVYGILDRLVEFEAGWCATIRREIADLEDAIDDPASELDVGDIVELRQNVRALADLIEDQTLCVQHLQTVQSRGFDVTAEREYFALLDGNFRGTARVVARLQERVRDAYEQYQLAIQEVTNSRLRILTVLSAVYLPATLVAGIYGMNFDSIPATQWKHGYGVVMLLMAIIVVGQVVFFSRRGWFK